MIGEPYDRWTEGKKVRCIDNRVGCADTCIVGNEYYIAEDAHYNALHEITVRVTIPAGRYWILAKAFELVEDEDRSGWDSP